jgi:hypothetical protein
MADARLIIRSEGGRSLTQELRVLRGVCAPRRGSAPRRPAARAAPRGRAVGMERESAL